MIVEALRHLAVPVDSLSSLPGNPRRGDVDAVARSLDRFGKRKPVVVDRSGVVIAGNHTLAAAVSLGWGEIAAVVVEDDEQTARAFALADNRTSDLGSYDDGLLLDLLLGVDDSGLLEATGYSREDVEGLLGSGSDGVEAPDDFDSFGEDIDTAHSCPKCGYSWG